MPEKRKEGMLDLQLKHLATAFDALSVMDHSFRPHIFVLLVPSDFVEGLCKKH